MARFLDKLSSASKAGICMLEYADTNAGKTASAITAPPRILYLSKEEKDARLVHSAIRKDYADLVDYVEFDGFEDEMSFLNSLITDCKAGKRAYSTIFHDGLTFSMTRYKQMVEDKRYEANKIIKAQEEVVLAKKKDTVIPDLVGTLTRTRKEYADWDEIAGLMARETILLNALSKLGLMVVTTAISTEYPKWNSTVKVAPSLLGKEFPKIIPGLFDTIGYIIEPFSIDAQHQHVIPKISFVCNESTFSGNSYMCRANGLLLEAERKYGHIKLDLSLIASIIRGEQVL